MHFHLASCWLLGAVIVGIALVVSQLAVSLSRLRWVRELPGDASARNDIVNAYLSAIGVFYGLMLGLIAVSAWENLSEVGHLISEEAATVGLLYRDLGGYPSPLRDSVREAVLDYVRAVLDQEWPRLNEGRLTPEAVDELDSLFERVYSFEPNGEAQAAIHSEVLDGLNHLVDCRRRRYSSFDTGLPLTLWMVILVGAVLTMAITVFFRIEDARLHRLLNGVLAVMIGMLIYVIAAMDHPYWGAMSVSSEPFELLVKSLPHIRP